MKISAHADAFPALVKTSSWYKDPGVVAAVAAPFAAVAADSAARGLGNLVRAKQKTKAFKSMLGENPHLRKQDTRNTQRYFNTLWTTNPEMAKDPIVAGAFVHQQLGSGDENFPHRGILMGASDMARMRGDLRKGAPPPGRYGQMVGQTIKDVAMASHASKAKALAEERAQFGQLRDEHGQALRAAADELEDKRRQLAQAEVRIFGETLHPITQGPIRPPRLKKKESSASSLRALLGV